MIHALLLLTMAGTPAGARAIGPFEVAVATTPAAAAANIRGITHRLFELQKDADAAGYAAARLILLENIALLQDWALRAKDPAGAAQAFAYRLTAQGRRALGRRKPIAADFEPLARAKPALKAGGLDFK